MKSLRKRNGGWDLPVADRGTPKQAPRYLVLMKNLFKPYLVSAVSLSVVVSGCSKAPFSQPTQTPKAQDAVESATPSEAEVERALLAAYKTRFAMTGKVDSVAIDTLRWGKPFQAGSSSDNGLLNLATSRSKRFRISATVDLLFISDMPRTIDWKIRCRELL